MKNLPLTKPQWEAMAKEYPTPFYVYDELAIRENARRLLEAFSWAPGFKQYFAVKAAPNPSLLKVLFEEGLGADCSSLPELLLAERAGLSGESIMFTSNNTPAEDFRKALELGAIVNLDDIAHLDFLESCARVPEYLCFRYNPGALRTGNVFIGEPRESKYGLTREQLFHAFKRAKQKGVRRFGLHTMVVSNEMKVACFKETADMLFGLVGELAREVGIRFESVNLGGGMGIPYRPGEAALDPRHVSQATRDSYTKKITGPGRGPLNVFLENGRFITGPYGYMVTRVRHLKETYKRYAGVDACMADLMRPGMYGAYHHITVPGKEDSNENETYDVTGSLCENNDKFAVDRKLPRLEVGDILVVHDTGAHGHSMGFNYNGKLRPAELLLKPDLGTVMIRRAETVRDYFATLDVNPHAP